jgi:hypothetical protein
MFGGNETAGETADGHVGGSVVYVKFSGNLKSMWRMPTRNASIKPYNGLKQVGYSLNFVLTYKTSSQDC